MLANHKKGCILKRKSLVALTAAVPAVALASTLAMTSAPKAEAATLPVSPAKAVAMNSNDRSFITIIIVISSDEKAAMSGMKSATPATAAKQLDT